MAGKGRRYADGAIIAGLAGGKCVRDVAKELGIAERTIFRRLKEASFRRQVDDARAEMVSRAAAQLADASTEAVATLRALLGSNSDNVRLGAAKSIVELGTRLRESVELENRISTLERTINELAK